MDIKDKFTLEEVLSKYIQILKENINSPNAKLKDYQEYFGILENFNLLNEKEKRDMFKENGFKDMEDFYNQRNDFYKNKSLTTHPELYEKIEGSLMGKINGMGSRAILKLSG